MNNLDKKIIELCDKTYSEMTKENPLDNMTNCTFAPGSIEALVPNLEQFRLTSNNINFHQLNKNELSSALFGLSKVLILPNGNIALHKDHFRLWAWCAELVLCTQFDVLDQFNDEHLSLENLLATATRATLIIQKGTQQNLPADETVFLNEAQLILAHLSFPLLEGVCKLVSSDYVTINGEIIKEFTVPGRSYKPQSNPQGKPKKISSLKDLLYLVSTTRNVPYLDDLKQHLELIDKQDDGFEIIYSWRNKTVHGSNTYATVGGTLLNMTFLILIHSLKKEFNQVRDYAFSLSRYNHPSHGLEKYHFYYPI
mgnify:CR=1 FL=1